jgi:hypothetical protein
VFHGLSFGKIGQPPMVGLPANGSAPGAPVPGLSPAVPVPGAAVARRTVIRTVLDFAQRERRQGRTR